MKKVAIIAIFMLSASFAIIFPTVHALDDSSEITCEVSKWQIYHGESITVTGIIDPLHDGVEVTLEYTRPVDEAFNRTVTSMVNGSYSDTIFPNKDGMWRVQASWLGDADTPGNVSSEVKFLVSTVSGAIINIGQNQTFSSSFEPATDEYYTISFETIAWDHEVTAPPEINFTSLGGSYSYNDPFNLGGGKITSYNITYNIKVSEEAPEGLYNITAYYDIYSQSKLYPYSATFLFRYELRFNVATSEVVPEFHSLLILPIIMIAALIATMIPRKRKTNAPHS
jgi:hypothetical protein